MSDAMALVHDMTSEERWLRWQQRGDHHDAGLMRRAKDVLGGILVATLIIAAFLLGRW